MVGPTKWYANKHLMKQCIEVQGYGADKTGKEFIFAAAPLVFNVVESEGLYIAPTMELTYESAKMLMDELWACGVRPSNEAGSVGELAAVKGHLKDMRDIAFALMDLKK